MIGGNEILVQATRGRGEVRRLPQFADATIQRCSSRLLAFLVLSICCCHSSSPSPEPSSNSNISMTTLARIAGSSGQPKMLCPMRFLDYGSIEPNRSAGFFASMFPGHGSEASIMS